MSQYQVYNSLLSRKLATSSTNFYDSTARLSAINDGCREFTDEYNPPELRKRAVVTFSRDGTTIHDCDAYNSATYGTFAAVAGTDAASVATDTTEKRFGDGSVSFNITPGASVNNYAEIEVASLTSLDLSELLNTGLFRMWTYLPNVTNFTSISLFIGSSSTDNYEIIVTLDANNNAFASNGWIRIEFDWANATTNGSPVSTALDYLKLRYTYSASYTGGTGFRVDDLRIVGSGTPKIDYDYLVGAFPSDLVGFTRIRRLENTATSKCYYSLDPDLYAITTGTYLTEEYNLTAGAQRLFLKETISSNTLNLLMTYVKNPITMSADTDDSGINSKADTLIALYAAEILVSEAKDKDALELVRLEKKEAAMTWHQRYGMRTRRLKSKFERIPYHGRP